MKNPLTEIFLDEYEDRALIFLRDNLVELQGVFARKIWACNNMEDCFYTSVVNVWRDWEKGVPAWDTLTDQDKRFKYALVALLNHGRQQVSACQGCSIRFSDQIPEVYGENRFESPYDNTAMGELIKIIRNNTTEEEFAIISRSEFLGQNSREIANNVGLSPDNVRQKKKRAILRLRRILTSFLDY